VLNLPTDRPHPATQTYRGATRAHAFPGELCAALRALSRQASVTLFTTLLAAFKVLLLRYGAGEDLVVGTNAANRTRKEVEGLIGFFVNALVLRTGLAGDPGFREALARVRETVLGAFAHQDLPFDRIVEELQPRRDLSVTPLFQVVFDMDPASRVEPLELAGLEIAPVPLPRRTAKFDLNLTLGERGEGSERRRPSSSSMSCRGRSARDIRWRPRSNRFSSARRPGRRARWPRSVTVSASPMRSWTAGRSGSPGSSAAAVCGRAASSACWTSAASTSWSRCSRS